MTTQLSTPTTNLSVGLKNMNTNKLSTVRPCLKLYLSYIFLAFLLLVQEPQLA